MRTLHEDAYLPTYLRLSALRRVVAGDDATESQTGIFRLAESHEEHEIL